nr:hypothetical protein [Mycoplasmopsis bovis]
MKKQTGVSKYKFRKKEALSKLTKTQEGLDQIGLVIAEIERKLNPLRKQAEKAKIFIAKTEELRTVEVGLLVDNIKKFGSRYEELSTELEGVQETKNDLNNRIKDLESKISQNIDFKSNLEASQREISMELDAVKDRLNNLSIAIARENERERLIVEGNIKVDKTEQINAYKTLIEKSMQRIAYFSREYDLISKRVADNNEILDKHDSELNLLNVKLNKKENDIFKIQTHLNLLKQQKEGNTLLYKGTKTILENKAIFGKGLKGTVADLIKVNKEYSRAIEAVLANALQHLVVEKSEVAVKAVEFLKQNNGGRATFIPLASIQPKSVRDDHLLAIQGQPGFIAVASEVVEVEPIYIILSQFLLGNVIVTETIHHANHISKILDNRYMIVTLDGDIIRAGGVIVGGAKSNTETLLTIDLKISELESLLPGIQIAINDDKAKQNEILNERRTCLELDSQLKNQLSNVVSQKSAEQKILDELNLKLKNISERELEIKSDSISIHSSEADLEVLSSRKSALEADFRAKHERINSLSQEINSAQVLKNDFESTLRKLLESFSEKLSEKEKSKLLLDQSRERLASQYKFTLESAEAQGYKLEMSYDQATEIVREIREEISKLGNVNLEALEQLVEEEERYNKFVKSEEELTQAKEVLESAIAQMDKIIITLDWLILFMM